MRPEIAAWLEIAIGIRVKVNREERVAGKQNAGSRQCPNVDTLSERFAEPGKRGGLVQSPQEPLMRFHKDARQKAQRHGQAPGKGCSERRDFLVEFIRPSSLLQSFKPRSRQRTGGLLCGKFCGSFSHVNASILVRWRGHDHSTRVRNQGGSPRVPTVCLPDAFFERSFRTPSHGRDLRDV